MSAHRKAPSLTSRLPNLDLENLIQKDQTPSLPLNDRPTAQPDLEPLTTLNGETPAAALFEIYEHIVEAPSGIRDAQIFSKIREWTFSNFRLSAHEFAGITRAELQAWQKRHRVNLSAGTIRPDPIDIQRGHAWSHVRHITHVNRLPITHGPPAAHELDLGHHY